VRRRPTKRSGKRSADGGSCGRRASSRPSKRRKASGRQANVLQMREQRQTLRQQLEEQSAAARECAAADRGGRRVLTRKGCATRKRGSSGAWCAGREELGLDLAEHYATYQHAEQDWEAIKTEIAEVEGEGRALATSTWMRSRVGELTPALEH